MEAKPAIRCFGLEGGDILVGIPGETAGAWPVPEGKVVDAALLQEFLNRPEIRKPFLWLVLGKKGEESNA